jgi:hypothetical protein
MMIRRALIVMSCAALIAGCGGGGGDDEPSANDAVGSYVDAQNHQNFQQVCELLSDQLRQQIGGANCARFIDEQTSGNPKRELKVIAVNENGDRATATLQTTGESGAPVQVQISLERQDGTWRITELAPGGGD